MEERLSKYNCEYCGEQYPEMEDGEFTFIMDLRPYDLFCSHKCVNNHINAIENGEHEGLEDYYKDEIKNLFDFSSIKINKKYSSLKNKVVLHVRRGDYLENNDTHPSTSLDYYKKCLKQLDLKSSNVLIVTDDIKNVSREFKDIEYTHINGKSELEDFVYIMNADYIIGCNSSFSWWAAYLSNSNNSFFPKKWFGPAGPKNTSDLYPENFIRI